MDSRLRSLQLKYDVKSKKDYNNNLQFRKNKTMRIKLPDTSAIRRFLENEKEEKERKML